MSEKVQKRFVTVEVLTLGEQPAELNDVVQDAIIFGVHKAVASTLDLNYTNDQGFNRRHKFVGISIKEIK